ncbi:hypothetical protein [Colwellia sp. UCD-KL20]|uniref:DUF6966 domain-containing protein n=1 Tax=Colwellia sp. UCD-KL20 TaxID=1917165 RepID=UPI000970282A|nr:hypothetical protein [Colwellia sp. UCD-KL20]
MELNEAINDLNSLFTKYGVKGWRLSSVNNSLAAKTVLNKFGGMGSLNDVYICRANGHNIQPDEEVHVNQKLRELFDYIYKECELKVRG